MKPLLLLTRPAEESAATAKAAALAGFESLIAPLMHIAPLAWQPPAGDFDALLFTSPQGPRHCAPLTDALAGLPAYAVGPATAQAVAEAGFRVAATGDRDVSNVLAIAAREGRHHLLHLSGADVAEGETPPAISIHRVPVYQAMLADVLPASAHAALETGRVFATLLFSPRTAQRFATLVEQAGLLRSDLRIVCLSPAIARSAGSGWRAVATASSPTTAAILAAARALWQRHADG